MTFAGMPMYIAIPVILVTVLIVCAIVALIKYIVKK